MPVAKIHLGEEFGKLTVLCRASGKSWLCGCACGNEKVIAQTSLRSGRSKSCGCNKVTHGERYHPLYGTWGRMLQRCYNPTSVGYKDYGGRGIDVCKEWHDIHIFIHDVGERPDGMSLDRKDNNLGYSKENCRWATDYEQSQNQRIRNDNTSGAKGVVFDIVHTKWRAALTRNGIRKQLGRFATKEQAELAYNQAETFFNTYGYFL